MSQPLFTSGTARGGTNVRAQILSANQDICLASDPYLPLFREIRNAVIRQDADAQVIDALDPDSYLDDYYFSPIKLRMMKYVQKANLDVPFDHQHWPVLRKSLTGRMSLASADLIPFVELLPDSSFLGVLRNTLTLIEEARSAQSRKWVGFNDNWAVEFFAPLARAFPQAQFMIFLRDPRAAVDSTLFEEKNPAKIPHVLSFVKHWRKYAAFVVEYSNNPLFDKRLLVSRYEPLILNPDKHVKEMTDFLAVEFDHSMLNVDNFRAATGDKWDATWDIYHSSIDIWQTRLPESVIEAVEFICYPEMRLLGYSPVKYSESSGPSKGALEFIFKDSQECLGWRTDFRQMEKDIGFELFRKSLLANRDTQLDGEVIERCFLFKEVFDALLEGEPVRLSGAH